MTEEEFLLRTLDGSLPRVEGEIDDWFVRHATFSNLPVIGCSNFEQRYVVDHHFTVGESRYIVTASSMNMHLLFRLGKPRSPSMVEDLLVLVPPLSSRD